MRSFWFCCFLTIISTLFFLSCSSGEKFNGTFSYSPADARPGEEINIKYNADSSEFAGRDDIRCIAYLYDNDLYKTTDVPLIEAGNVYSGTIKTDDNTFGVLLKFISGNDIDNNDNNGYTIFLIGKSGDRIPGSLAGYGEAINHWGAYYLEIDRDKEKAFKYMDEELKANPEIKPLFLDSYFDLLSAVKPLKKNEIIEQELAKLEESDPVSEDLLLVLHDWYKNIGDNTKADYYKNVLLEKFPDGKLAERQMVSDFKKENDPVKKLKIAKDFEAHFPESEYREYMYDVTANVYRDNQQYDKAFEFLKENVNKTSTYRFYSVAKRMFDENADMNTALAISKLGVNRSLKELENPSEKKPVHLAESEWTKEREYYLGINYFVNGKVLYRLDMRKDALDALKKAVKFTKQEDDLINELYAKMLIENGKYDIAMTKITDFIKSGQGTAQMKAYLKEAYLNEKGTENGFDAYAEQFENAARELLINKLKEEMVLEPAPNFSLEDLNGSTVSLKDFKGKVVVIDFWATWCGPCRESFPAMKMSVEKFQDDDNVKFLFINAWERAENKFESASNFISKNEYPFHVLVDADNQVIAKYMVSGIPTKFIIDGEGNIRFKSVGFEGADDKLVEEISTMISMID